MRRTAEDLEIIAARILADGPITVSKAAKKVPADNEHGHASPGHPEHPHGAASQQRMFRRKSGG